MIRALFTDDQWTAIAFTAVCLLAVISGGCTAFYFVKPGMPVPILP